MTRPLLHTCGLAIGYRGRTVADGINISLFPAEAVCLLGGNGAGKSTLFKTLLRLLPPLSGTVYAQGCDIAALPRARLAATAAYVPQAAADLPGFSVAETVLMGCAARLPRFARPGRAERLLATACLDSLNIGHMAARRTGSLSGGEKQLVWIARALVQQPRLLVMDEPTASLDFANQVLVLESIVSLAAQGYSVLFSSHRPEHALQAAGRLLVLQGGKITAHAPAGFITADNLAALYGLTPAQIRKYAAVP